jgi:hypothetical protein
LSNNANPGGFDRTRLPDPLAFAWGLNENNIPPELLPKARAWFQRRMDYYAAKHGTAWADTREWIADYINEELREHLAKKGGSA